VIWNVFDDFNQSSVHQKIMEKDSLEQSQFAPVKKHQEPDFSVNPLVVNSVLMGDERKVSIGDGEQNQNI
jgi:hypothetical protein